MRTALFIFCLPLMMLPAGANSTAQEISYHNLDRMNWYGLYSAYGEGQPRHEAAVRAAAMALTSSADGVTSALTKLQPAAGADCTDPVVLLMYGYLLKQSGDGKAANDALQRAAAAAAEPGRSEWVAKWVRGACLQWQAYIAFDIKDDEDAVKFAKEALAAYPDCAEKVELAGNIPNMEARAQANQADNNAFAQAAKIGGVEGARKAIEALVAQAERNWSPYNNLPGTANGNRAADWLNHHKWADFQRALPASEILIANYPNDPNVIRMHHFILGQLHRWKEACDFGAKAKETVEKSGNLECLFWVLFNQWDFITQGRASVQDEEWGRSFKKYHCSQIVEQMVALAESMESDDLIYKAYGAYAWHHSNVDYWKRALSISQRNSWDDRVGDCNRQIGMHYLHSNQIEKATAWSQSTGAGVDGQLYIIQKDWPNVFRCWAMGIDALERETLREPNERLQRDVLSWNTRMSYDATAVAAAHINQPADAIKTAERMHNRMLGMVLGASFERGKSAVIVKKKDEQQTLQKSFDILNAQLAAARKSKDAGAENSIQRDLKIQSSALEGISREITADEMEISAAQMPPKMSVPEMQALLGTDDAILMYFTSATPFITEGFIAVIARNEVSCAIQEGLYVRASDPASIRPKADDYLKALISVESGAEKFESLKKSNDELYRLLIKPILAQIKNKRNLIIIPSGPLSTVPIHLLRDERGRYLIEEHAVSYVPSVGVLKYALARNKRISGDVTVVANPLMPQSNSSLKFAETEAQAIAQVFPEAKLLLGDRATETAVKAVLETADILHFACHGTLDTDEPMKSALALTPDETNDGMLTAREICDYSIKAGLVVLSSCESGAGGPSAGWVELVGMTRSWLLAGAPSVVVSLWKLDDKATSELMAEFYKNLKSMGRAEALQKAQLVMMKKYENPYYWGAFVLYGDYR